MFSIQYKLVVGSIEITELTTRSKQYTHVYIYVPSVFWALIRPTTRWHSICSKTNGHQPPKSIWICVLWQLLVANKRSKKVSDEFPERLKSPAPDVPGSTRVSSRVLHRLAQCVTPFTRGFDDRGCIRYVHSVYTALVIHVGIITVQNKYRLLVWDWVASQIIHSYFECWIRWIITSPGCSSTSSLSSLPLDF